MGCCCSSPRAAAPACMDAAVCMLASSASCASCIACPLQACDGASGVQPFMAAGASLGSAPGLPVLRAAPPAGCAAFALPGCWERKACTTSCVPVMYLQAWLGEGGGMGLKLGMSMYKKCRRGLSVPPQRNAWNKSRHGRVEAVRSVAPCFLRRMAMESEKCSPAKAATATRTSRTEINRAREAHFQGNSRHGFLIC